ncbi:hypothetical protein SDC9_56743 [bioreactor metagenome]|uniref:Uncharacterized protein n=1 Tax=bioreactor metagenome TaxID=1076179 RepID=A0A644X3E5_9ZZZZ
MHKALLTFSNNETLELCEGQLVTLISKHIDNDDKVSASPSETYELWNHSSAAMIPSVCEFLCRCDFFHLIDDDNKVYNSKAVVTIQNI